MAQPGSSALGPASIPGRGAAAPRRGLAFTREGSDTLVVVLAGDWSTADGLADVAALETELQPHSGLRKLRFESIGLREWDSSLVVFVDQVYATAKRSGIELDPEGLPEGLRRLLRLATAVPRRADTHDGAGTLGWLARLGAGAFAFAASTRDVVGFVGEVTLALLRLLVGKARFRGVDFLVALADCGPRALPIVSLISVLTGMILAFVGAIQLRAFGAEIFVANLVGIGMAIEMGALMTGIIMAGRAGASFAAQIGTMQVNEEIDALKTTGLDPIEFLVLPRALALLLLTPLLTLYSVFLGMLGGAIVGTLMLDLSWTGYFVQTQASVTVEFFAKGLIKAAVFGLLIGIAGCLRGIQCGRSAQAVGVATTSAVVTSLILIVVSDSIITVIYDIVW